MYGHTTLLIEIRVSALISFDNYLNTFVFLEQGDVKFTLGVRYSTFCIIFSISISYC